MKALIILNPGADRGRALARRDELVASALGAWKVELEMTARPGDGTMLAKQAVKNGYQRVIAAGGDGTVHEIINGIIASDPGKVTMGVVPIGSGNDFAYGVGASMDFEKAVDRAFHGMEREIDLARLKDDRGHSLMVGNAVGIGFDATINIESRRIRRIHGFAAYTLATLRTIAFHYHSPRVYLAFDEEQIEQSLLLLAIGVGPRVGGGFLLTPDASPMDALLDSCLVRPMSRAAMLAILPSVMRGTHTTHPKVQMRRSRAIRLRSNEPVPIHVDGEIFATVRDNVRSIEIESVPQALRIVV